jgi:hypothetical protein
LLIVAVDAAEELALQTGAMDHLFIGNRCIERIAEPDDNVRVLSKKIANDYIQRNIRARNPVPEVKPRIGPRESPGHAHRQGRCESNGGMRRKRAKKNRQKFYSSSYDAESNKGISDKNLAA